MFFEAHINVNITDFHTNAKTNVTVEVIKTEAIILATFFSLLTSLFQVQKCVISRDALISLDELYFVIEKLKFCSTFLA